MNSDKFSIDTSGIDVGTSFLDESLEALVLNHLGDHKGTKRFIDYVNEECPHIFIRQVMWDGDERPGKNVYLDEILRIKVLSSKLLGSLKNSSIETRRLLFTQHPLPRKFGCHSTEDTLKTLLMASTKAASYLGPKSSKRGPAKDENLHYFVDELVLGYRQAFDKWPHPSKDASVEHNFHYLVCDLLINLGMVDPPKDLNSTDREKQIKASLSRVKSVHPELL